MSSLRLALKLSMEADAPADAVLAKNEAVPISERRERAKSGSIGGMDSASESGDVVRRKKSVGEDVEMAPVPSTSSSKRKMSISSSSVATPSIASGREPASKKKKAVVEKVEKDGASTSSIPAIDQPKAKIQSSGTKNKSHKKISGSEKKQSSRDATKNKATPATTTATITETESEDAVISGIDSVGRKSSHKKTKPNPNLSSVDDTNSTMPTTTEAILDTELIEDNTTPQKLPANESDISTAEMNDIQQPHVHVEDEVISTPRYQSSRAAAQVAKTKLSSRGTKVETNEGDTENGDKYLSTKLDDEALPLQWVSCDNCSKWRSIPGEIDLSALPEQWYCSMNEWDSARNSCEAEEYTEPEQPEIQKETKNKNKRKSEGGEDDFDDFESSGKRRGNYKIQDSRSAPVAVVEKVNWVECSRCKKWRKAPLSIDVESLPDTWHCALNTWNIATAKCSVKEETDEPAILESYDKQAAPASTGRGYHRRNNTSTNDSSAVNTPSGSHTPGGGAEPVAKKVIQWVQCERKSCKKWRKIPGHVDLSKLPEKWFCEMNQWDTDRASCDVPDSDAETETVKDPNARSQLITGNTKGPGTLSYRRIIFGTDGKVRPTYNEKNKIGYGIFSEIQRKNENHDDSKIEKDSFEPLKRIEYWWSKSYNEKAAHSSIVEDEKANQNNKNGNRRGHGNEKEKEFPNSPRVSTAPWGATSSNPALAQMSSSLSKFPITGVAETVETIFEEKEISEKSEGNSIVHAAPPIDFLNATRKLGGYNHADLPHIGPIKHHKRLASYQKLTLMERERIECTVIRSCLLAGSLNTPISLSELMKILQSAHFHADEVEVCKRNMSLEHVKSVIRRLEIQGEAIASILTSGELCISLVPIYGSSPKLLLATKEFLHQGIPLKLRKWANK